MADLLSVQNLSAGYGRAVVLSDVAFQLGEGEALAVLGRNGVGKTTLIDSIVGVTRRFAGSLSLGGREIGALAPETRAALGIGWVPQERNIFRSLTVQENITAVARPGPWTLDRISVLVNGALFVEGAPDEVARDPRVKAVYLGEGEDRAPRAARTHG